MLMKKALPLIIFIFVQLASLAVLTLWIVGYVLSRSQSVELFERYGIDYSLQSKVWWLLQGIFLMVPVIVGATVIFVFWTKSKALDIMRMNFISTVSHELFTPLAAIRLAVETMIIRNIPQVKQNELLRNMLEDSERLSTKISNILLASRFERRKVAYHLFNKNLSNVIENYIEEHTELFKNFKIHTNIEDRCFCEIDEEAFQTVLRNLFENAKKYSPNATRVDISLKRYNNRLTLSVKDYGEGIQKKDLSKIFKIFYRVSKGQRGTGLGLYIVNNIVRAHQGKIWAESNGCGKGSCFNIHLPAQPAQ